LNKKHARTAVDVGMTVLLLLLMAHALIGERFHEIIGTCMLLLFILHHNLNRAWFGSLQKGKYNAVRVFRTVLDLLLLLAMLLQPLSGILISKHLYIFLPVSPLTSSAREIHLTVAYWGFLLMSLHAGTHLAGTIRKLLRAESKGVKRLLPAVSALIALYGCYAFFKRSLPDYLLHCVGFAFFDYSEPKLYFFLDYLSMMLLFFMLGALAVWLLSRNRRRQ